MLPFFFINSGHLDIFRCNYIDTFIVVAFLLAWEVRNVTIAAAAAVAAAQVNRKISLNFGC